MAVDMYLKIETIDGETTDKVMSKDKACDILAWSWGISNSGTAHMGGGAGAGKANFQDISVTKYVDSASNALLLACATGEHFPSAKLTVRKAGTLPPVEFLTITLSNARLTSLNIGTAAPGSPTLSEQFALAFEQIEVKYAPQRRAGDKGADLTFQAQVSSD